MKIKPANRLAGEIRVPGDKSISHRAVMFGSIASGETRISNFAVSADCRSTIECFRRLGIVIEQNGSDVVVRGAGKRGLKQPSEPLDCGNSGTTMRLMAGILAGQRFASTLTGDESLQTRPMKRVIEPLTAMGAEIESRDGLAPLTFSGRVLKSIVFEPPVASAQVKSCVLLAGLYADGQTRVIERVPTRDHTELMMRQFGVEIEIDQQVDSKIISVSGDAELRGTDLNVPGDISSAAFFLVAAACLPGSDLRLNNVGLNQSRSAVLSALDKFGVELNIQRHSSTGEPAGDIQITATPLNARGEPNILRGPIVANLIDEIPILAVLGTQLPGGLEVRDAGELRVKESDRIRSVVDNLRRMNAAVEEFDDGFRVTRSQIVGAAVDSYGDHRIAMAFGVAALLAEGETEIGGSECVDVSYPGFFRDLEVIAVRDA
ncbi:MAG TPA: 3-phosphoshikimate 1-carboxyvinyltransferase [Pyrinomonadaceae bacterium]